MDNDTTDQFIDDLISDEDIKDVASVAVTDDYLVDDLMGTVEEVIEESFEITSHFTDQVDIVSLIEEKTGHKLDAADPALAFIEITRVAGEMFASQINVELSKILELEKQERLKLANEAAALKTEIVALRNEINSLTEDKSDAPSVLHSLRTTAAYIYSEIKRIGG